MLWCNSGKAHEASQSLLWRAIEAASRVGAARRPWGTGRTSCSASCTSSGSNSLLTAPIEAAYTADRPVQSRGSPTAGADRRRPRCPRPPPLACSVLALAAFAGPAQCSRVGSTRHRAAFSADGVLQGPWGLW